MGCWGMGITQSDEYCEIYERFMEEYDEGKPLADIKRDIIEEYLAEFDEHDGVLHDVYFAIGKGEWMCGGISDEIHAKISHIINSGANIAFYAELEATSDDLKLRKKNLDKFLASLSIQRGKTKKRRIPTEKYVKTTAPKLPIFSCGDIFSYEVDGKYRLLSLTSRGKIYTTYAAYCYVWTELFDQIPPVDDLINERILPLGYFTIETFPKKEKLKFVGNNPTMKKLNVRYLSTVFEQWKPAVWALAKEEHLSERFPSELGVKLCDCIENC